MGSKGKSPGTDSCSGPGAGLGAGPEAGANFEAMDAAYRSIYGSRWDGLLSALRGEGAPCGISVLPEGGFETDPEAPEGMYRLDRASLAPACALALPREGQILDACAAPGGKTLILAARACPLGLRILANELSSERRRRLSGVLDGHLPPAIRALVTVTGKDAGAMCRDNEERFGAILLDAPCSSERHVLASPSAMAEWTPARSRNLAARQWALLSSAFIMLKPGGCLVYSTCTISPRENDGVMGRLMKKYGPHVRLDPPEEGEATEFGRIILPDRELGAGPIYLARVYKRQSGLPSPSRSESLPPAS